MAWTAPRTWVTGEVVTASQMNTHLRDNLDSLGRDSTSIVHVGATPFERWYPLGMPLNVTQGGGQFSVTAGALDTLRCYPFVTPRGRTIDRLAFEVTTGGSAGSKARVGIYGATSATQIYPDALVLDGGEHTTTSTGVKATTVSQILEPDVLYWAVYLAGTAAPTVRSIAAFVPILGVPSTIGADYAVAMTVAQSYGALPSTFPAGGTLLTSVGQPLVVVRYSA